jgi:hypothetical protein
VILNTPAQELVAQILFWGSACGLPLGLLLFVVSSARKSKAYALFGSVLLILSLAYWYYFATHLAG